MRTLGCLVLVGCGRLAFEPIPGDTTTCSAGAFSIPTKLPGPVQSISDDWFPTPSSDELELYYYEFVGTAGDADIVRATRTTRSDLFSAPSRVIEIESSMDDTTLALTADGLYLVMARSSSMQTHLYEANRATTAAPFSSPTLITSIDGGSDDLSPWLSPDGLRMTFGSRRTGLVDLYESTRASRVDLWGAPVSLAPLNTADHDDNPTESADGLEIYFSSDRPGGSGAYDVYRSTRPSLDQAFAAPVLVPELSSAMDDIGTHLSFDGRTMYLNYNSLRAGNQNADLSTASRGCNN